MSTVPILAVVRACFALAGTLRERAETKVRLAPLSVMLQPVRLPNPDEYIRTMLVREDIGRNVLPTHSMYLEKREQGYRFADKTPSTIRDQIFDAVIEASGQDWIRGTSEEAQAFKNNRYSLHFLKSWQSEVSDERDRRSLILGVADTGLAFIGYKADALGLGDKAEQVVGAVALGLSDFIGTNKAQLIAPDTTMGFARRMAEILVTASLSIAASRPDLFSEKEHVQEVVRAVMNPLTELNSTAAGLNMVHRIDRIGEALRGEIGISVLQALYDRREDFFGTSDNKRSQALKLISESFFEAVVADSRDNKQVFSAGFLRRSLPSVFDAAADAPEAFVRGKDTHVKLGQDLFAQFSGKLKNHIEGDRDPEFARSLFDISIGLTRKHARRFLVAEARGEITAWQAAKLKAAGTDPDPWALVSIEIVSKIADEMISAFETKGLQANLLSNALDTELLLDLVGIVAAHAAETPGMILPKDVNPEVVAIAKGVAAFVASEHAALVSSGDWKRVSAKAVELAMANPETLFSLKADSADGYLATRLVKSVLASAHASLLDPSSSSLTRGRGQVLFGETLAGALIATLETAAANARRFEQPDTFAALELFIRHLNTLSTDHEGLGGRGLSSSDWLNAFSWFAAEVVATGNGNISPERIGALIDEAARRRTTAAATSVASVSPASNDGGTIFYHPVAPEGAEG